MTLVKGIAIRADEGQAIELVEFEGSELEWLQRYVGGYVQFVDSTDPPLTFVMNEEGKVFNLPLNRRATLALWAFAPVFVERDVLNGDVLILGPADDVTGETLGVPDDVIDLFFNTSSYRYMVKTIGDEGWSGNGRTYDNFTDAANDGFALARRWTLVTGVRVVPA